LHSIDDYFVELKKLVVDYEILNEPWKGLLKGFIGLMRETGPKAS